MPPRRCSAFMPLSGLGSSARGGRGHRQLRGGLNKGSRRSGSDGMTVDLTCNLLCQSPPCQRRPVESFTSRGSSLMLMCLEVNSG
ncbi:hypothetical protein VPH35_104634 [Triticum aestivum]